MDSQRPTKDSKLADRLTGRPLRKSELAWIESQLPRIRRDPFAKLLILILLLNARMLMKNYSAGS